MIGMMLFLLFPVVAAAQNPNMQNIDMEKMMQAVQEMQQCMAKVDQGELKKLEQETEEMEAEFRTLCEQGKRDKAQNEAIKFSKKLMTNPTLMQMKECAEITKGFVPEGAMEGDDEIFDPSKDHVCDDMN
jgi:hypothetical protein